MARQAGLQATGHGNQRHAQAFDDGQDGDQLVALATVGQAQHHVARLDHAQVAMAGFAWVHEHGGCAGGGQGGGNLGAHMAAFAHACDDHTPAGAQDERSRLHKAIVEPVFHGQQGAGFNVQRFARHVQGVGGVELHGAILSGGARASPLCRRTNLKCSCVDRWFQ